MPVLIDLLTHSLFDISLYFCLTIPQSDNLAFITLDATPVTVFDLGPEKC